MSYATIELHGGPLHGEFVAVPLDLGDTYSIVSHVPTPPELHTGEVTSEILTRKGAYTRVYTRTGSPTDNFEWAGYE